MLFQWYIGHSLGLQSWMLALHAFHHPKTVMGCLSLFKKTWEFSKRNPKDCIKI